MRTLVTGGAGYIGSVMSHMLADEGHDVLVVDDFTKGHHQAVDGLEVVQVDITDDSGLTHAFRRFSPDCCMHFAARSLVGESTEKPLDYFHSNVAGGITLLEALISSGCRSLVFSSTAAVYGIPGATPVTEDSPMEPVNPYGLSKAVFERILAEVSKAGFIDYVSLRYFNAAGADLEHDLGEDHSPETHLIPRVLLSALSGEPRVYIYGTDYPTPDGTCVRDYVHVLDLARAHMIALEHLLSTGTSGSFNVGNGRGFSVREVIDVSTDVCGCNLEVIETGRRQGDPPVLVAAAGKANSILGWKPEVPGLEEIIRSAWEWHSKHPAGYTD
jgi:UDP-glucose 4-epimerase